MPNQRKSKHRARPSLDTAAIWIPPWAHTQSRNLSRQYSGFPHWEIPCLLTQSLSGPKTPASVFFSCFDSQAYENYILSSASSY